MNQGVGVGVGRARDSKIDGGGATTGGAPAPITASCGERDGVGGTVSGTGTADACAVAAATVASGGREAVPTSNDDGGPLPPLDEGASAAFPVVGLH